MQIVGFPTNTMKYNSFLLNAYIEENVFLQVFIQSVKNWFDFYMKHWYLISAYICVSWKKMESEAKTLPMDVLLSMGRYARGHAQ